MMANSDSEGQPAITGYPRYKDICGDPQRRDIPELSMRLQAANGNSFSLYVDGYEFPAEELGPCEDNPADGFDTGRILIVTCSFTNSEGSWRATGTIMDTEELERLAQWFESIVEGKPSRDWIYFLERDLELSLDETEKTIQVRAYWEFLPPWSPQKGSTEQVVVGLDFPLAQLDLMAVAKAIRLQLATFPGRPPIDPVA